MNLTTFVELIDKYGLALVLLIALLLWIKPKIDDLWNLFIKKPKEEEKDMEDSQELRKLLRSEIDINLILNEILMRKKALRVGVWQFHNGVRGLTGIPFMKATLTHEVTKLSPVISLYQNIPVSLISNVVKELLDNDFVKVKIDDLGYEGTVGEMKNSGVKTTIYVPIRDHRNCLMGAITIAFLEEDRTFSEEEEGHMKEDTYRIATILETMATAIKVSDRRCSSYAGIR